MKPKNNQQLTISKNSFTLVELLMVITLITLFTGFILASYSSFNQQKILEKEASIMIDVLGLAKGKSQASDVSFDCALTDEFGGYRVQVDETNYNFRQCCRDVTSKLISSCSGPIIQSYTFNSAVRNITGSTLVNFSPLTGASVLTTISLRNDVINKCLDISITDTGVISILDFPYSC